MMREDTMGEQKFIYRCTECDSTKEFVEGGTAPTCCKKVMVLDPLPPCTLPDQAEMVRNEDEGGACDDGRGHGLEE